MLHAQVRYQNRVCPVYQFSGHDSFRGPGYPTADFPLAVTVRRMQA